MLGRRLIRAAGRLRVQDARLVEPEGVNRQEPVEVMLGIPFLVIDQPELLAGALHDAMMAWPQHAPAAVNNGVARIFHEGPVGDLDVA